MTIAVAMHGMKGRPRYRWHLFLAAMTMVIASFRSGAVNVDSPKPPAQTPQPFSWVDSMFGEPFIDKDEWRDTPVRHRYVHGGFKGTETLFSIYFPPKERYQGRFFQPIAAFAGNEKAAEQLPPITTSAVTQENTSIGFAVASGGYLVVTNNGSKEAIGQSQDPSINTVIGYRANAAAAEYSRVLAAQMYGPHRPHGYAYGGSGGSLKTVCGFENTFGVWDGAVPYVYGTDVNMPSAFTVQAYAERVLKDKFPAIDDALEPGGSGDMYAGLNAEQRAALREVTRYGFPPRTWYAWQKWGYGPFAGLINSLVRWDPTYFDDFWKRPGYEGAHPTESLQRARIQQQTTITKVIMSDEAIKMGLPVPALARGEGGNAVVPALIQVQSLPPGELKGASLIVKTGGAAGKTFSVSCVIGGMISLGFESELYPFVNQIKVGDELQIDNSIYLAAQTYHRHQVPSPDYVGFDEFRDADGKPIYPQRPRLLGHDYNRGNSGCSVHSGVYTGKMIMVETLMDQYAYPWQADWYRSKVKANVGAGLDDTFRVWYVDNAIHGQPDPGPERTHIVEYTNVLQQALRDVAAWAEKGTPPPASTNYKIVDAQVVVPPTAAARRGIQPVVTLTANKNARAEVAVGQPVTFEGTIEVPPGTGKVAEAEWDFEGKGDYPELGKLQVDAGGTRATVSTTYAFSKAGTYFPALRVASQRQLDSTPYARIENLARVRVVVK